MPTDVTKPSPVDDTRPIRVTVESIDRHHTLLRGRMAGRPIDVVVASQANTVGARRWLATVRRVDRVEIDFGSDGARARVSGHRHRLPFCSPVPMAVALGLGKLGVTVIISGGVS